LKFELNFDYGIILKFELNEIGKRKLSMM